MWTTVRQLNNVLFLFGRRRGRVRNSKHRICCKRLNIQRGTIGSSLVIVLFSNVPNPYSLFLSKEEALKGEEY
jgi:hypothetical protein